MSLMTFAESELKRAGMLDQDSDYEGELGKAVLQLIEFFSNQGHSGFSAGMTLKIFQSLADFKPLSPLTGDDNEWVEVGEGIFQNNRCSTVFKQNGEAYNIDGKVFREPSGACFTSIQSRVPVTFPYTPTTEYVDVGEDR